ncbi:MAG: 23S rRNA (adenine(2503)-C(2))-methyltransferase RlmN [Desulfobacterales bacterium]|nr:23S rRNA (adenine(2503)-C(2))-methyltransferase RlmN [Desulfobacterales bacterium]
MKDLDRTTLGQWLVDTGEAPYRADQILRWVFRDQVDRFDAMTNLKKDLRQRLAAVFDIGRLHRRTCETAADGTRKYLFELVDGERIESVLIPERDHYTLCLSTQVGCAQGCRFCLTASGGLGRNLTQGEILAQVRDIRFDLEQPENLTNIVFMGMGEPLANYRNLIGAIGLLQDNKVGFGFSKRKITVSTAGLVPRLADLGRDTDVGLAVSLNATDNETRSRLMPINRRYPLEVLLEACRRYPLAPQRRITFEYILLAGINDSPADARRLSALLRPIRAKINLIPFNDHPGSEFRRPDEGTILAFQKVLVDQRYTAIIRRSKGREISAACGQLRARATDGD